MMMRVNPMERLRAMLRGLRGASCYQFRGRNRFHEISAKRNRFLKRNSELQFRCQGAMHIRNRLRRLKRS